MSRQLTGSVAERQLWSLPLPLVAVCARGQRAGVWFVDSFSHHDHLVLLHAADLSEAPVAYSFTPPSRGDRSDALGLLLELGARVLVARHISAEAARALETAGIAICRTSLCTVPEVLAWARWTLWSQH